VIHTVIKVGGRLGRGKHLRDLCEAVGDLGRRHRLLIVPGGGAFADAVRRCDARMGLSDTAAHWMAILAMDQYGYMLADLIPGSTAVRSLEDAEGPAETGGVPVLLPFDLMRQTDALPHSWTVTADSIAAWVAGLAGAHGLVLLKDQKGLGNLVDGAGAASPHAMSVEQLARWEGVDSHLPHLLRGACFHVWILNGERPEQLGELLETGRTVGIRVLRCDASSCEPLPRPPDR
jgi:aspartokinase-like uncharacterized kinase